MSPDQSFWRISPWSSAEMRESNAHLCGTGKGAWESICSFFTLLSCPFSAFLHGDFLWYLSLIRPLQHTSRLLFCILCRAKASIFSSLPPALPPAFHLLTMCYHFSSCVVSSSVLLSLKVYTIFATVPLLSF